MTNQTTTKIDNPRDLSAPRAEALALAQSLTGEWEGWTWAHDPGGVVLDGPGAVDDWDAWQAERRAELDADDIQDRDAEMTAADIREALDAIAADERQYGEEAQQAAEAAEHYLDLSIEAMEAGLWATALDEARSASRCEYEYGDDPTYGPLVTILQACQ